MSQTGGGAALTDEQRKQYVEAMESLMKGLHSASFVMQTTTPGESMYDGAVGLMKVDDAKTYLAQYQKSLEEMQEATKAQEKPMFRFTDVKKIELDGEPGLSVTFDMSGMLAEKNGPEAKVLPLVLGKSGKLTARIIVADEHTLLAAYGSEAHAKESLAAFKNPKNRFAADPDVAATLKLLQPHAQWIGLMSVKGYLDLIGNIMSQVGVPFKLPELPTMPPIGFAAEAGTHGLDTQLVLPAETLAGVSKAIHGATGK